LLFTRGGERKDGAEKMKRIIGSGILVVMIISLLSGAAFAKSSTSIFDSNFDKNSVRIKRIAIIPNRLPLTLQEPEMWRKYCWHSLTGHFQRRGFEVLDYESTLKAVQASNLPLEDTGTSEEKFNRCAQMLDADVIVMPYYGTSFQMRTILFFYHKHLYYATVSLQFYSRKLNKFFFRSDSTRRYTREQAGTMIGSMLMAHGYAEEDRYDNGVYQGSETQNETVGHIGAAMVLYDFYKNLQSVNKWYKKAFSSACWFSLKSFFAVYPKGQ